MILFIALPLAALATYALGGLDYLRRQLLPSALPTNPVGQPYTPPYTGGQCVGVTYNFKLFYKGNLYDGNIQSVGAFSFATRDGLHTLLTNGNLSKLYLDNPANAGDWTIRDVVRADGQPDLCGDPPNPNAPPSIAGDGVAGSPAPNVEGDGIRVVEGVPPVAIPSFAAALAAALAAARNAADALAAVKAIADAIAAVADAIDALRELAKDNAKDKDKEEKEKSVYRYDFGSIRKDGFRRLYPDANSNKLRCSYLDIQILSIPINYGKYFGEFSPNFYRFKELGYISFVSPTFGVMEVRKIEFSRMSLEVPENAYGFFWHLGLDGAIVANASAFYVKKEKQP